MSEDRNAAMSEIDVAIDKIEEKDTSEVDSDTTPSLEREIEKIQEEENKSEEEQEEKPELEPASIQVVKQTAQNEVAFLKGLGQNALKALSAARRPGGLFLPIALLLLFFLVLIPINGYSRLAWLWLVLLGDASITGESTSIIQREQALTTLQSSNLAQLNAPVSTSPSLPSLPSVTIPLPGPIPGVPIPVPIPLSSQSSKTVSSQSSAQNRPTTVTTPHQQIASSLGASSSAQQKKPIHPLQTAYKYQGHGP